MADINWKSLNPFAKFFVPDRVQEVQSKAVRDNSQGMSEQDLEFLNTYGSFSETAVFGQEIIDFQEAFGNKFARKVKYREMSFYPEITQVIDSASDDAVVKDDTGAVMYPGFRKEIPNNVEKQMKDNFDYLMNDIFKTSETAWSWFRKWLIEAEMFVELVSSKNGKNIVGYKILPSAITFPVYEGSGIIGYVQETYDHKNNSFAEKQKRFTPNQVVYSNYGVYGRNSVDVLGYLENSIRVYNQLRGIEDALVTYRIARAPERRIWNVEVSRMSTGKANEYMKRLMQKYRRRAVYDPETGDVDSVRNTQSLIDDFWFPKRHGDGTTVESFGGNMQMGELEDVRIFQDKMYKSLKYPKSRWSSDTSEAYSMMKPGEVQRDEVSWSRFTSRNRERFGKIYLDAWIQLNRMTLSTIDNRKWNRASILNIDWAEDNLFELQKDFELLEQRFNMLSNASAYIYTDENPDGFFSSEFMLKKYFKMNDSEFEENRDMLKAEKIANPPISNNDEE